MWAMLIMKNHPLNTFGIDTTIKTQASKLDQECTEQMGSQMHIDHTVPLLLYFHMVGQYFMFFFVSLTCKVTYKLNSIHYVIW